MDREIRSYPLPALIETLLFVWHSPLSIEEMESLLKEAKVQTDPPPTRESIQTVIAQLIQKYQSDQFVYTIEAIDQGYQLFTKPQFAEPLVSILNVQNGKQLSRALMETLAVIAYRQPITKAEIEAIRGVDVTYAIEKLLERELIEVVGRSDLPGKPLLFGTSRKFMTFFGLKSINDLPDLKEVYEEEAVLEVDEGGEGEG